ncbi:galanin-like G-protein coupled receptor npr-9 [Physella acuta]|uniref:galanin-like G-protein coupled receptor npr-9 n=1 Tax=Physella acuta TaxID=109671 RepID=UPI0027DB79EB|nr:galanin-like G-protein coupled receptor npr-9 [Physella acuta]
MASLNSTVTLGSSPMVPKYILDIFMAGNIIFGELITIIGIIANIINIVIFRRQGYDDTVNISLTALAVSDLGSLVTLLPFNVMVNPWFESLDLSFVPLDVSVFLSFYPHNYFIRVCGFITAFAAFERCLCVVLPLKVKQIITKKVAITTIICIYLITLLNEFPSYYVIYLDWKKTARVNKTVLSIAFRSYSSSVFSVSYFITDMLVPHFTFLVLIACTSIIVFQLKSRSNWIRSISSTTKKVATISNKEKKVGLMLVVVSVCFIVCLTPQTVIMSAVCVVPGLGLYGKYFDVASVIYCLAYYSESINSSLNILVYYKMSSKYKKEIHKVFPFLKTLRDYKVKLLSETSTTDIM